MIYPATISTTEKSNNQSQQQQPEEWRPHGEGQYYACPGEPEDVFEERMQQLLEWLRQRPEQCIVLVTHWGVLHYLVEADEKSDVDNCGVVNIEIE
jgi:broad specificity phosphatase PhoE